MGETLGVRFSGRDFPSSLPRQDRLWGPPRLLFIGYRDYSWRGDSAQMKRCNVARFKFKILNVTLFFLT